VEFDARFIESPNGPVVVADAQPQVLMDQKLAVSLCNRLSTTLGGMPALLRCRLGDTFVLSGSEHLRHYGVDPILEALPLVRIDIEPGHAS
jgi:hypothetical protein